jgi:D-psicose/D-tagatose/L-ribulose 3-epimerase
MEMMMPRYGVHAMVWVGAWSHAEAERAITGAARAGYDLLEIPLLDPDKIDLTHTRTLLELQSIKAAVSLGLSAEADVSSADLGDVNRGRAVLAKALHATAALGGDYLGGVIYSALKKYTRCASPAGRANAVAVIRDLAREARMSNIDIGLEAVNRYETNLLNTGAQTLRFIDEVGESNVFVHLDTFHMNIEEADCVGVIELCAERLGYFHVNENHRGYLGSGSIAFSPSFRALRRIGYDRTIAFEAFSSSVAGEELGAMVAAWRDVWSDSDDIAEHAFTFMRREFADAVRCGSLVSQAERQRVG